MVLVVGCTYFGAGCHAGEDMILEYRHVQFFQVSETSDKRPNTLVVSGLAFHSAFAVSHVTTVVKGASLVVNVHLTQARAELSGSFRYELVVPEQVDNVLFGKGEEIIWKRPLRK